MGGCLHFRDTGLGNKGGEGMSVVSFRKKVVYSYLALLFGVALLLAVAFDITATVAFEEPSAMPSSYAVSLLLGHGGAFYLFLLGFVYAVETQVNAHIAMALAALAVNVVALVGRICVTILFLDLRPTQYAA